MQVYDFPGFPNPIRVRVALAEKGLLDKVEFVKVDVPAGEHRKAAFLAINPSGAVPVLKLDDGTTIAESTAITEYLDHLDGRPELTGRDAKERAVIHMIQRRLESGFLDAVAAYFHHATPGLGPDIETVQIESWGQHQRLRAQATMAYADELLEKNPFVAGSRFTVADITLLAGLIFAGFAQIPVLDSHKNLQAWRARVEMRDSVRAVLN